MTLRPEDLPHADLPALATATVAGGPLRVAYGGNSRFGALRFYLHPAATPGDDPGTALVTGLRQIRTPASQNWVEADRFSLDAASDDGRALLARLLALPPPGGHVMVEYDSPEQTQTAATLLRGWPPVATPLGWTLFQAGAVASFKDWYYSEGGSEGPRKLQAFRPLDAAHDAESAERALPGLLALSAAISTAERTRLDAVIAAVRERTAR